MTTACFPCQHQKEWLLNPMDPMAHARNLVDDIRSWGNYTFYSGEY